MWQTNMLLPYLYIWDWDLIFGRAVKAISSPGVRTPWQSLMYLSQLMAIRNNLLSAFIESAINLSDLFIITNLFEKKKSSIITNGWQYFADTISFLYLAFNSKEASFVNNFFHYTICDRPKWRFTAHKVLHGRI